MEEFKIILDGSYNIDIQQLCRELNSRSKRRFVPEKMIELPEDAYDKFRRQYDAIKIFNNIPENIILLTDKDIFANNLNFIIGMTYHKKSIINLQRLYLENNRILFFERVFKEILKQMGYMSGLQKCEDPQCLMSKSAQPKQIDKKSINLCTSCNMRLAENNERI